MVEYQGDMKTASQAISPWSSELTSLIIALSLS